MAVSIKGADIFKLALNDLEKASIMAINKATATTVARMKDRITDRYNIKRKDITSHVDIIKANKNRQESRIVIPHNPLGLIYFGAKPAKDGVRYKILKGKTVLRRHAFIFNIGGNGDQVYERYGNKELPLRPKLGRSKNWKRQRIRKVSGMAISQLFLGNKGKDMQAALQGIFTESVRKELFTASKFLMGKR
jgi:hypothetical protein